LLNRLMVIILSGPAQFLSRRVNHPGQFSVRTTPICWSIFSAQQHAPRAEVHFIKP
jgi:hypothetical protein